MPIAVVPAGNGSSASSGQLSGTSLDPMVADIGLLTGVLLPGSNNGFALNSEWFDNPVSATRQGVRQNAPALTDLLERILGSIGGNALGLPAADPALLGTWIPIPNPANGGQPTNFYVVSYPDPAADSNATVFGFGVKVAWTKDLGSGGGGGGLHGPQGVLVEAWGLLPLLKIDPDTGVSATVAEAGYPLNIGIAIEGQAAGVSAPIIAAGTVPNEFAFSGVKLSANIDLAAGPAVDMSLVVLELLLPGETTPVNRSLADLEALPASEIMQVASTLFVSALADASQDAADKAAYFLPLVGLSEFIPGLDTRLPLLPWWTLAGLAIQGENVTAPFIQWFTSIVSSPDLSKAWLYSASGLLGVSGLTPAMVTGTGTREDPFLSPLIAGAPLPGNLFLSVASWVDDTGLRHFYPGLSFQATPIPLGTTAELAFQTTLELAEFKLYSNQPAQFAGPSSLRLETSIALRSSTAGQPLYSGSIGGDTYVFGAFEAGLTVDAAGDVLPLCQLTGIQSPTGNFDVIDLTSPGQLAAAAMDELQALIQSGFKAMLGLDGGSTVTFAADIAALIGVIPPPAASSWPSTAPQPPFSSVQQIAQSLSNPVTALASYYQALLTSTVQIDGQPPFYYVLASLASLFQETGAGTISITGGGTADSPWNAVLSVGGSALPAALTVYTAAPSADITRLFLGLNLGPTLTVGNFQCQPLAEIHFVSIDLPAPGVSSPVTAQWLPDVGVSFNLPQGFQTPSIAGSYFSVSSASVSAVWSRFTSWHWSLFAQAPVFNIGGTSLPFSGNLDWNDQSSLQALVLQSAAAFAPVLTGVIGVALTATGTRIGTAATGVLGLLPDPAAAANFPPALQAAWTAAALRPFTVTSLGNPWPDFCAKLANDFSTPANGAAVLGLLGWALNPGQTDPPAVSGDGAMGTPWRVPLAGTAFEFVSSYDTANSLLGLGLGRTDSIAVTSTLAVEIQTTLAAAQLSTATGDLTLESGWPSLQFTTTLSNPAGNLVEIGTAGSANYTVVREMVLGFAASLVNGSLAFVPVVSLLGTQLPGQSAPVDYTWQSLAQLPSDVLQGFQGALNQAVQSVITTLLGSGVAGATAATFSTAYDLLSLLGLTLPVAAGAGTGYGINPGGWQGLAANPLSYIQSQLLSLLLDPASRETLFDFIGSVLGIEIPTVPPSALATLSALGFLGDAAHGYPLRPQALLQFAQSPFTAAQTQFATLYSNGALTAQAQALVSALNESVISTSFGKYFSFNVVQGTQIQLSIAPGNAFSIGDLVSVSGAFSFDLVKQTLTAEISLYNSFLRLALQPSCAYTLGGSLAPALELGWGDGTLPVPQALVLYPFNSTDFLNQLSELAPSYVLTTVVNQVMQSQILTAYPVAQFIFQALGLASKNAVSGQWVMPSLLGLLNDPLGWLLSPGVLGDASGNFSLASLQTALARIPAAEIASLGLGIRPYADSGLSGVEIYGFPYGFGAVISTDGGTIANFLLSARNLALAGGTVEVLSGGISLGADFQPGVLGDLQISGPVSGFTLFAEAGYNKGFFFSVGQKNTGTPLAIQLVPFAGWGTMLEQAVQLAAATLLGTLVPQLLTALKNQGPGKLADFATGLQTAGTDLDVASLVTAITSIPIATLSADTLGQAVLTWMIARFNPANAPSTADAVVALVSGVLPGTVAAGTGADAGLVTYQPAASVPLTVYLGVSGGATPLLGLWAGLGLPATSILIANIERTGVGFAVSATAISSTPVFQFGVDLQVPVEQGTSGQGAPCFGPWLSLEFDAATSRFTGNFDPLYNSAASTPNSSLEIELFPDCTLSSTAALETWILGVMKNVLPRYVSVVVLNTDAVKSWLNTPVIPGVTGSPTAGAVLLGSQLLTNDGTSLAPLYVLTPFDVLASLTVEQIIGGLFFALMQNEMQVLKWGSGDTLGGLWIGPEKGTTDTLGLRVAAPGLTLSAIPNLVIQLGAADDGWITKASSTPLNYEPGLSVYVPNQTSGQTYLPNFSSASVNLVNVGIDFTGTSGRPLVDLARFQLGGVSPRVLFSLNLNGGSPTVEFGGAFELDSIAISLAPNQVSDSGNPVAQNLLGSGGTSDGGDSTANPPANPSFSIQAAYINQLYVGLLDANGQSETEVWIPVQRGFGPLYVNKVGIGWEPTPPVLDLLFDGSVALAGFEVDLIGLSVGVPISSDITNFSKYSLSLDGFDISFSGGAVDLTAQFLKTEVAGVVEYSGLALIKISQFSIMAVGSYAAVPTNPPNASPTATSLFIFGALNAPLGGVPAFFITGIAAGFSYNRGLILPPVSGVQTFPLVQGVVDGTFESNTPADAQSALEQLSADVYPEIGEYWLAAGLKFTSFRMLNGFGLLFIEFGNSFEIALLGVASLSLPQIGPPSLALAYAELAIKAVINTTVGFVSVEAQLTPNSFVLAEACKLTGGFAFYLWFKNQTQNGDSISAGDFVVTLGGYSAAFQKPAHYPDVPRLGFYWPIDIGVASLSVAGGAYFALTPSAVMAGGYLKALFKAGPIKAWFDANADFYIAWAPFYFVVDIGVEVGVSFGTTIAGVSVTLSASLGANLHLQGPPTGGSVGVNWYVISFTIPFGEEPALTENALDWTQFEAQFLPEPAAAPAPEALAAGEARKARRADTMTTLMAAATGTDQQQVVQVQAAAGLVNGDGGVWTLQSEPFVLQIDSAIPIDQPVVTNPNAPSLPGGAGVGVQPSNISNITTPLSLTITDVNGHPVDLGQSALRFLTLQNAAPQATWGTGTFNHSRVPDGADMLITGTLKSVQIIADQTLSTSSVGPFDVANLAYTFNQTVLLPFASQLPYNPTPVYQPSAPIPGQDQALAIMMSTIMDPAVAAARESVFGALAGMGIVVENNPDLSVMASSADLVVQAPPVLAHLGVFLATSVQAGAVVPNPPPAAPMAAKASAPAGPPQLRGILRRHRANGVRTSRWSEMERPAAAGRRRSGPRVSGEPVSSLLYPGTVSHWEAEGDIGAIGYTGEVPARFTCFDHNDELVGDLYDRNGGTVKLPPGTQAVSAYGSEPDSSSLTEAGWDASDEVLRVNSRWFLGEAFTLRPQACIALRRNRRRMERGLIDIAEVQALNRVTGGRAGGIETVFAGDMKTAAIRVPKGVEAGDLAVSLTYPDRPSKIGAYQRLTPSATVEDGEETIYFYTPPGDAPSGADAGHFSVWVAPRTDGARVLGVRASTRAAAQWAESWRETPPPSDSPPGEFTSPLPGRIIFIPASA
ncbi:MAG: DUF6603 domain-containing protein [Verrucomicrobiota bacterium]